MKVINFAAAAALMMLVAPVLLCSCNSTPAKKETKQEVRTPKTAADEPKPVEITSESSFAQEVPAQAEPAKAEVAKAPEAPAKAEVAKAPEAPAREETVKAPEAPAKAEVAKAPEAPAREETVKAPKAPAKSEKPRVKSAKAKLPCEHTVRTGDNLWKISRRYYGSGANWKKIYEANKSEIRKPEFLEPGTVLKIPAK
jgi:nucleoid-associated protein YgaU